MSFASDPRSRPARGTGTVLVTGATGFLGRRVCRALAEDGQRFRALVRTSSDRSPLDDTGAWMVEGDLRRPESLTQALDGVDVVLHLAGVVKNPDPELNRAVHVDGTRHLLAAATTAGVRRIVAISSDTVLRPRRDPYAQSKADAEALLAEWPGEAVVLRPSMMLGEGSPHLAQLRRMSRLPLVPIPPQAADRRPVRVEDVVPVVLAAAALESERLPDGPIDLQGPHTYSFEELIGAVARADGRRAPRFVRPSPRVARIGARLLGRGGLADGASQEPEGLREGGGALVGWAPRPPFAPGS